MAGISFKVVIFGNAGVGKTTLIDRYTTGVFSDKTTTTLGVDFYVKKIELKGQKISLQLWDFMGQERFRVLLPKFVAGAKGGVFMFDITRAETLRDINAWIEVIKECRDKKGKFIPLVLVGGKLDLQVLRTVDPFYGKKLVEQYKQFIKYIECSSKTGENVELIFSTLAEEMLKRESSI